MDFSVITQKIAEYRSFSSLLSETEDVRMSGLTSSHEELGRVGEGQLAQ